MSKEWHYVHEDKPQGPIAEDLLRGLLSSGTVPPDTPVWHAELKDWVPADETDLLASSEAPPPLPPQAAPQPAQQSPTTVASQQRQSWPLQARLPAMWVGYALAAAFLIGEFVELAMDTSSGDELGVICIIVGLAGWIYWLSCIFRFHKVLREATSGSHPVSPGQSIGYLFIPFYNLYWIFKWPNEVVSFVREHGQNIKMMKGWPGVFIFFGTMLSRVDASLAFLVLFSVGVHLKKKIRKAIMEGN